MDRVIGTYTGREKGPLFFVMGGVHGNERAGVLALELLLKMIEVEPITHPNFTLCGRICAMRGNIQALELNKRFIESDLNRMWKPEIIDKVMSSDREKLDNEEWEMYDIIQTVWREIEAYKPDRILFMDLHTTSATGGIFSLPSRDNRSIEIALGLEVPVIIGFIQNLEGTTVHFFDKEMLHLPTVSIAFESGQHNDPQSVNRAIAAVINCMVVSGMIDESIVENTHNDILKENSKGLPRIARLVDWHPINKEDEFVMLPGFHNFQLIKKGEELAKDKSGVIKASSDGLILMPMYQKLGEDGFFIIEVVVPYGQRVNSLEPII